ncbi:unnamed protein product [Penicillium egyptiacum]|uniref:Uncharacterized protein n=1 Tax=Penicillium egyptiacum TaxID=1303716 RepID=A0A9W4K9W4_9EURO|nr:unnamed protein product [Penicillium egyptiacum]
MDFWAGDTDPSLIQFFTPDTDTDTNTNFKIANTALDPGNPVDEPFIWVWAMKHNQDFIPQEMHHHLYNAFSKYLRKSPGGSNTAIFWDPVLMEEDDSLFNSNDQHGFTIRRGATSADGKTAYQLVVMKSENCYHGVIPSFGELIVLVRWMLSGIKNHKHQFGRYHRNERPQLDFPTMAVSFLPDARVRVLYGYFDEGRLKVAYTQSLNFDAEDYANKMDGLLQWACPLTDGDTTKPFQQSRTMRKTSGMSGRSGSYDIGRTAKTRVWELNQTERVTALRHKKTSVAVSRDSTRMMRAVGKTRIPLRIGGTRSS